MRQLMVSAAAVMAITGAAAVGNAQMQDKGPGQDRPGAERAAPPSGSGERAPDAGEKTQKPSNRTERKSEPRRGAEREPSKDQPKAAQQPKAPQADKDRSKSAAQPQRDQDKQKSTAQQRPGDKDKQKSTEQQRQRDQDKQKSTEQQRPRDQDKQKSTEQQRQRDQDKQKSAKGPDDKQAGRVQVTEEKRSGVRERLVKQRVERVNRTSINVSINVGARIPRSVRLHTLPVTIVSFAPAYRGYSYIMLEDETICIVDPRTYAIVDVIAVGSQRADRPGRTHLTLSADDMRFIYRTAPKVRTANVRIRLALGAEVPRDVELMAFPDDIVERVPDMRRYRYIVSEGDIVIVDPDDHAVALVINE